MAKKHKRHFSSRRRSIFGGRRHHRRRNPILGMSGGDLLTETVAAVASGVVTRMVPQVVLGANNTGIVGYGANAVTGLMAAWLASKLNVKAGHGALLGAAVAVASRVVSDMWGSNALGGGMAGDLGGDLGFYVNNGFPLPTGSDGPLMLLPGYAGSRQQLSIGIPGQAAQVVTTPAGSQAVSAGSAGQANAALATATQGASAPAGVWSNPWAA